MTKRFVISGCSRSGTRYISNLLTKIGCECAHDNTFLHYNHFNFNWVMPPYGGASWFIAPVLSKLPEGTLILHQIRDPFKFIRSRLKKGQVGFSWIKKFLRRPKHSIDFYAKLWVKWNKMVEKRSVFSYKIEDFNKNSEILKRILDLVEFKFTEETLNDVYKNISQKTHSKGPYDDEIKLKDISNPIIRFLLKKYSKKFGYL